MGESNEEPLFQAGAEIRVEASPEAVYEVISDLGRSAEWSPECLGGEWVHGDPGAVGSVFRGRNHRAEDVVGWAPVVRGTWYTESEVVAAEPGRAFRWAMRTEAGAKQDSVWSFEIEPTDTGCVLAHRFRMGEPTEGIRGITAEMDDTEKRSFTRDWGEKVAADLQATVVRIRDVVESERVGAASA
jgi:hypothetical protein